MSNDNSDLEKLARRFYRDHKKVLDLVSEHSPGWGFVEAVRRVFGAGPRPGKAVRIGNRNFIFLSQADTLVSFLPARWRDALDGAKGRFPGCEKWWAGYPFITWVEVRANNDGRTRAAPPARQHGSRDDAVLHLFLRFSATTGSAHFASTKSSSFHDLSNQGSSGP
ncbi:MULTISPECIES: hypothetical protein [unclassified Rhizobium]|uniref:hypothetical protein n=1 Tax=unclassified Rhizobium TaxID=2613769 RepID=UPI001ADD5DD6|nr:MULTISPECIES: hypothetical protein [unclassified Rhizobium]MBO9125192.1 hypothetical protein [Rhizobium sp. 16-488-2b]MBO9175777.1 hypothetical protein [Rhizobium sp. 16-488-2a]